MTIVEEAQFLNRLLALEEAYKVSWGDCEPHTAAWAYYKGACETIDFVVKEFSLLIERPEEQENDGL